MYKKQKISKTSIRCNEATEGETIEQKIERVVNNKEPITDGAPIMYTERSEGVLAATNIRTDRFDIAIEAMDTVSKNHAAKRKEALDKLKQQEKQPEKKPEKSGETPANSGTSTD